MIWGLDDLTNLEGKGGSFMPWISSLVMLEYLSASREKTRARGRKLDGGGAQDVEFSESPEGDPASAGCLRHHVDAVHLGVGMSKRGRGAAIQINRFADSLQRRNTRAKSNGCVP
jgi:hypothetical protein